MVHSLEYRRIPDRNNAGVHNIGTLSLDAPEFSEVSPQNSSIASWSRNVV